VLNRVRNTIAHSPFRLKLPAKIQNEEAVTAWVFSTKRKEKKCVNMGRKQNLYGLKDAYKKCKAEFDNF